MLFFPSVPLNSVQHLTFIFNTFVFMGLGNMIASREVYNSPNVFRGLFRNWLFWASWLVSVILQVRW